MAAIDPLTAGAVFLATAATDAVYVMFTSAVVARKRVPAATWEQRLVCALVLRCHQLHRELDIRRLRRDRFVGRCLFDDHLPAPPARRPAGWRRAGVAPSSSLRATGSRVGAPPMTGSAKQSIAPLGERMDCFVPLRSLASNASRLSQAMTASGYSFAISRRVAPEVCISMPLLENRGRREERVRAAPAVWCASAQTKAHTSIQVQRKHSGLPCAVALRLTSCSPR